MTKREMWKYYYHLNPIIWTLVFATLPLMADVKFCPKKWIKYLQTMVPQNAMCVDKTPHIE